MSRGVEADVEGRPHLAVRDEDREAVAEIVADVLIAAFDRETVERSA